MKKCKSCQTEIDNKAIKCPHCQSDQRNWFRRHPVLTFIIICFVLPPLLISLLSSASRQTDRAKEMSLKEREPTPNAEQIKQRLLEQKEWEQSKAGKICIKHPEWKKEDCQNLADNLYWIGMTYDMLVYSHGKPDSANPSNYGAGTKWQWCWDNLKPSCFYDNNDDGVVDSYN